MHSLICHASKQNLTLREAGFRVLQARAELCIAIGGFFPQSQFASGTFQRIGLSKEVANRQFIAEAFYNQTDLNFALAWELDFWGRFRRAIESADADLDASVENYDAVLVTLLGDVAENYILLRTVERQIELVKANIQLQKEALTITEARFKGGLTTELDVDQARSLLGQTEALVPRLEIELRRASNRLCVLLGIPPEELRCKIGPGIIPIAPMSACAGMPADLLRRRPDVRRAERVAAAQSARIGIAETDLYPAISITGNFGYSAQDISQLLTGDAFNGRIGPSFRWNIFNYGRLCSRIELEDARFKELVTTYQDTVLRAAEEVENGLVGFLKEQQRLKFLTDSVDAAEKAVRIAIAQYKGGTVDFNRVAVLAQDLVNRQVAQAGSLGDIGQNLVRVYRALGGGWEIRLHGCDPNAPPPGPHPTATAAPAQGTPATPKPEQPQQAPAATMLPPAPIQSSPPRG
jgi:NodT family efflux transporter outer membrane factor (OMF) lipoprotein